MKLWEISYDHYWGTRYPREYSRYIVSHDKKPTKKQALAFLLRNIGKPSLNPQAIEVIRVAVQELE